VFTIELQTSLWHSRITFSKKLRAKKNLGNQVKFHFEKNVWDFESPIKSYGQNLERGWKGHFLRHFQTSSLNFVHNFFLDAQNHKWNFEDESELDIFNNLLSSNFFVKSYFTMPKWGQTIVENWFNELLLYHLDFWQTIYTFICRFGYLVLE